MFQLSSSIELSSLHGNGLLIGRKLSERHLAIMASVPSSFTGDEEDVQWNIGDHACAALRMLPSGVGIIGLFGLASEDLRNDLAILRQVVLEEYVSSGLPSQPCVIISPVGGVSEPVCHVLDSERGILGKASVIRDRLEFDAVSRRVRVEAHVNVPCITAVDVDVVEEECAASVVCSSLDSQCVKAYSPVYRVESTDHCSCTVTQIGRPTSWRCGV
jgi:hypothetical protein